MCANAVLLIDLAFIGHLDTEDLAAMNLANVVMFGRAPTPAHQR